MTSRQRALMARAGEGVGAAVRRELAGQWCDALPLLTCLLWGPCRASLASPGLQSTISAVQFWSEVSTPWPGKGDLCTFFQSAWAYRVHCGFLEGLLTQR